MRERERLLARCAAQRDDLAAFARQVESPLHAVDRVAGAVQYVRRHPLVLGVAVAAAAAFERRMLWRWLRRGLVVWRTYRAFGKSRFRSAF